MATLAEQKLETSDLDEITDTIRLYAIRNVPATVHLNHNGSHVLHGLDSVCQICVRAIPK